ncbi:APC family permease [Mycolicibacterium sp. lyk4-40-TYG-92]|uniref:APC family permease n=1 Tax=Mycolicibacterium sp. lyk4-40-TYG-92 TaxID=3040295 RepID=UPI00254A3F5E|nr:APC family permease [Mycolicibacterium sp. lyk4-40-TYG-92]
MSSHPAVAKTSPDPSLPPSGGKGLQTNSVGLLATVTLGLASVAPAYSIAVTLGFVVMVVGHMAPASLLLGFVPILLTAFAFRELNREMPDCGTTFVWTTRAFGPYAGWLCGGWVVQIATLIAMSALAKVGATYLLGLVGLGSLAADGTAVLVTAILILATVTAVAYRGLKLAAGVQYLLLVLQLVALFGFGIAAFARGSAEPPHLAWLNPFALGGLGPAAEAVLLCLFIYWGWDALITVNEETVDSKHTPGRAAVISTLVLLGTYLFTAFAAISFAGTGTTGLGLGNPDNAADVLATLGRPVLGTALAKVVQLAICVSAISALLTCLVSSPRATLSMGSHGALPKAFTRIHPTHRTPAFGTMFFGIATAVMLSVLTGVSQHFLGDAILSIGLLISLYYGVTGLACVWHFRHRLRLGTRALLFKGVLPAVGALMMLAAFARSTHDTLDPHYGGTSFHGIGGVFLLGIGSIVIGAIVMMLARLRLHSFFRSGRTAVTEPPITEE